MRGAAAVLLLFPLGCGAAPFDCPEQSDQPGRCAGLPGVSGAIDFDDLGYSAALGRIVAPLRGDGVALVDPESFEVTMLGGFGDAGSATEGAGLILVADRGARELVAVDPVTGDAVASAPTAHAPDYVRYVEATGEVWVTEPGSGIEVFELDTGAPALRSVAVIATPGGPEGLAVSASRGKAYAHAWNGRVLVIDIATRAVEATWSYGCAGSHGIPAVDDAHGLLLAGCSSGGEVHLIDLDDGRDLGGYAVGDGAALMAFSAETGHFYGRGDPGVPIAVLAGGAALQALGEVTGSESGHCLIADDGGHVWTGDKPGGQLVRIDDPY